MAMKAFPGAKGGPARAKNYEKSAADKKADLAGAKKAGTSVAAYEKSPADKKADAAAMKKGRMGGKK